MEADQPLTQFGDSSGKRQDSSEARRYLEVLMEHEDMGACVHSGCPECRLLAKIHQFILSEVFTVNAYPVSIRDRKTAATEVAAAETAPATQRTSTGLLHSSVCATGVAETCGMASKASASQPLPQPIPFEEQIRRRAYDLYIRRGGQSGSELDDWLQAAQELLATQPG
jgi:hypothetical protein